MTSLNGAGYTVRFYIEFCAWHHAYVVVDSDFRVVAEHADRRDAERVKDYTEHLAVLSTAIESSRAIGAES